MSGFEVTIKNSVNGNIARVTPDGQLRTQSESIPAGTRRAIDKAMWSVISEDITLTSAAESGVLYLRYTGTKELVVSTYFLTQGETTGGTAGETITWRIYANPTTGTLISNATAALVQNRNFSGIDGSLSGDKYKGATGATVTNGTNYADINLDSGTGLQTIDISTRPIVLENGNSIALTAQPPTGNTSQLVRAVLVVYEIDASA